MQTVMFHDTILGPIHSRRLGTSLGINLSPRDGKVCTFDCLYCEAGFNAQGTGTTGLPSRALVAELLEKRMQELKADGTDIDVITFSGNGEPTVHPEFSGVIDDTITLRDRYFPTAKVSVLSNSTMLARPEVTEALHHVDNCILKLDSAIADTVTMLDRPTSPAFDIERVIGQLASMGAHVIVQTMITRGSHNGITVDNSTDTEINALIDAYRRICPREIMIYSLDRPTPEASLQRVPREELLSIATRITDATGIPVQVA
ncbi:MAG: radical SAM protein [Odoribacter sp.]|nr:radical SAM protein [Odoribacter sp.]